MPCQSEQEVLAHLQQLHQLYPGATHIAFAYHIKTRQGFVSRFNDAGEPAGTAGKPIYQHLEGKALINVLIAIVRYFGGIKLGAGGLLRAYGNTAKKVIEAAELTDFIEYATTSIILDYKQLQGFEYQLKKLQGSIIEQSFTDQVELLIRLPQENLPALAKIATH